MKEFLTWFLATRGEPFDIAFLNIWHILYLLGAVGGTLGFAYYIRNKSARTHKNILDAIAYALVIVYLGDFFLNPFYRASFTMDMDKLPFHICTLLCPVVAFVQCNTRFAKFFDRIKEPVVFLAIVAPMMYLVYPGSALNIYDSVTGAYLYNASPFCYRILQTFIYHGLLFAWGVLMLTTKQIVPRIKNCYKSLIGLVLVAIWAGLGNTAYVNFDWFFINGSTFGWIVEPHLWLLPPLVVSAIFSLVMAIYGIYYAAVHIYNTKIAPKKAPAAEVSPAPAQTESKEETPANV